MDVEAFILIGGRSTRFGTDKAFFKVDGEPLATRAAKTVERAFPSSHVSFVAASEGQFGIKTEGLARPVLFDVRKGLGAWSGLETALRYSRSEWTLVLACDLPFLTVGFLQELAGGAGADVDAIVPRPDDGPLQPLCALYRTSRIGPVVEDVISKDGPIPPIASLFETVNTAVFPADDDVLKNVNSPADLM